MTGRVRWVDRGACSPSTDCLATEMVLSRVLDEIFSVDGCVLLGKIAGRRGFLAFTVLKSEKYPTTRQKRSSNVCCVVSSVS